MKSLINIYFNLDSVLLIFIASNLDALIKAPDQQLTKSQKTKSISQKYFNQ